jgi:hypothetical protein
MIEGIRIFGNVDNLIGNADAVERAIGGCALDAGGLAVNGDGHNFPFEADFGHGSTLPIAIAIGWRWICHSGEARGLRVRRIFRRENRFPFP